MVEQPREAVEEPALLELPAGKLDVEGETPLECAQRELAEEIGKSAGDWRELKSFYTSPGFANERVWLFLATELYDTPERRQTDERIEIVEFPLDDLDTAIGRCEDAKSLDRPDDAEGAASTGCSCGAPSHRRDRRRPRK